MKDPYSITKIRFKSGRILECQFLEENGYCILSPLNGCDHTTENQNCGIYLKEKNLPDSPVKNNE